MRVVSLIKKRKNLLNNNFYISRINFSLMDYNDLYEILRKEKYAENLQLLPKNFIKEFKEFLKEKKETTAPNGDFFSESTLKSKKQLENAVSIFKEITLRRKKKILNLAFVATETGIMKRDFENMLDVERGLFERLVKSFEEEEKEISRILNGGEEEKVTKNRLILFTQNVEQFIDSFGNSIGPFKTGELVSLNSEIAKIFVDEKQASLMEDF